VTDQSQRITVAAEHTIHPQLRRSDVNTRTFHWSRGEKNAVKALFVSACVKQPPLVTHFNDVWIHAHLCMAHRRETVAAVLNIVGEVVVAVMVVNCYSAAWQWVHMQVTCMNRTCTFGVDCASRASTQHHPLSETIVVFLMEPVNVDYALTHCSSAARVCMQCTGSES
jgi:hypothetical protein